MKIAVTAEGQTLDDAVDPRFGRCAWFVIVDSETMAAETVPNPNLQMGGGAGIQSAQLMGEHDVDVVATGNCGPNAYQTLNAADVKVIVGVRGSVREVVEQFKSGQLMPTANPNVASHFGMGQGGGGRGMGGGISAIAPVAPAVATGWRSALVARVDAEACVGCGLCADVCPAGAVTVAAVAVVDSASCTGCGQCVAECPQEAIVLARA